MNERIPIISVGGGWVVNNRHLLALRQSGLFNVLGAVSNDGERAKATAGRFGLAHHATALDFNLPWQAEAKAVMIGSIPHAHFELARASLLAGKHVLTEKPMTIEPAHAKELIRLAAEKQLVLAVVHNFQFSRAAQRFRDDMAAGRLGAVKAVYGVQLCNHQRNIPAWCDELPLGLFFDEAPHFYYLFRWLAEGDLNLLDGSVWKSDAQRNTPRAVSAEYKSHRGIPFRLHINFDSSITEWHVTAVCEKCTVDIDVWRDIYVSFPNDGEHRARDIFWTSFTGATQHFTGVASGALRYFMKRHLYGNDQVVRRFHQAIQGEDSLKGMSAADGLKVVEMMHELIQKARPC